MICVIWKRPALIYYRIDAVKEMIISKNVYTDKIVDLSLPIFVWTYVLWVHPCIIELDFQVA